MSSEFIEGVDVLYATNANGGIWAKMWHGFETLVDRIMPDLSNVQSAICPIVSCGVEPRLQDLATPEEAKNGVLIEIPAELKDEMKDWKLILADCRKGPAGKFVPLHIPKKGYAIHDNLKVFGETIQAAKEVFGGEKGFEIASLGTVGAYSQAIMSIAILDNAEFNLGKLKNGAKDTYDQFLGVNTSHNGLVTSGFDLSTTRRVCMNTNRMAISYAEANNTRETIKHTVNSTEKITAEYLAKKIGQWREASKNFHATLKALKAEKMTVDQFRAFAAGVFTIESSKELSTTSFNRIEDQLVPAFNKGDGNYGVTRYDAQNAFTQVFTHDGLSDKVSKGKRLAYASFGRGNDWKGEALRVLGDIKEFDAACKRGEKLFTEKQLVMAQAN